MCESHTAIIDTMSRGVTTACSKNRGVHLAIDCSSAAASCDGLMCENGRRGGERERREGAQASGIQGIPCQSNTNATLKSARNWTLNVVSSAAQPRSNKVVNA